MASWGGLDNYQYSNPCPDAVKSSIQGIPAVRVSRLERRAGAPAQAPRLGDIGFVDMQSEGSKECKHCR